MLYLKLALSTLSHWTIIFNNIFRVWDSTILHLHLCRLDMRFESFSLIPLETSSWFYIIVSPWNHVPSPLCSFWNLQYNFSMWRSLFSFYFSPSTMLCSPNIFGYLAFIRWCPSVIQSSSLFKTQDTEKSWKTPNTLITLTNVQFWP